MYNIICTIPTEYKVTSGCWNVEKRFDGGPGKLITNSRVALTPNGDIVVFNKQRQCVLIYGLQGSFKKKLDTSHGKHSFPGQMIVSKEGNFYVSDRSPFIAVFNAIGRFQYRFHAVSPEGKPSDREDAWLRGLAMDNNRHILVGECRYRYISKHTEQGRHVESFKVNIKPYYLLVTPNNTVIIISSFENEPAKIIIIDQAGQVLHTLLPPRGIGDWKPSGVHCCKDTIFIANSARVSSGGGIYCYSMSADYMGHTTTDINDPFGMVVTDNGRKMTVLHRSTGSSSKCSVTIFLRSS